MYKAREIIGQSEDWIVERQYACINGLSAWFVICVCHASDENEIGYTNGNFPSAKERAEQIAKVLNTCGDEYG